MKKIVCLMLILGLCLSLGVPAMAATSDASVMGATVTVSSAGDRTAAVASDGTLWMWGNFVTPSINPKYGSMDMGYQKTPVKIMTDVVSVSCSKLFTAAIKKDGSLWMWGLNSLGQLGNSGKGDTIFNNNAYQLTPIKVMDDVVAVSCGFDHTAVIKTDGSLWMFGSNRFAQIGNGYVGNTSREDTDTNGYTYPVQDVPQKIMDNVVAVSCGKYFTAAIKEDGTLWTWGWNKYNQLGNSGQGDANTISKRVVESGKVQTVPIKITDGVISVSCGSTHAAVVKEDGSLWVWGQNSDGCLGLGSTSLTVDGYDTSVPVRIMNDVTSVYCGNNVTAAIKTGGSLWTCGWIYDDNDTSQAVGTPIKVMDSCRFAVVGNVSFALKDDNVLYGWGSTQFVGIGGNGSVQYPPTQVLSNVAFPITTNNVKAPEKPSVWAEKIVADAIAANLVPENLQKGYKQPISRGEVMQMFVNLIEQSTGKPIGTLMAEKGVSMNKNAFTDTSDEAILAANALGIVSGTGNNKFSPNGTLTRAQAATIINRIAELLGIDTSGHKHNFVDVNGHWASSYLGWPASVGIVAGVGDNKFSPDTELTTEQAITIAYRTLQVLK